MIHKHLGISNSFQLLPSFLPSSLPFSTPLLPILCPFFPSCLSSILSSFLPFLSFSLHYRTSVHSLSNHSVQYYCPLPLPPTSLRQAIILRHSASRPLISPSSSLSLHPIILLSTSLTLILLSRIHTIFLSTHLIHVLSFHFSPFRLLLLLPTHIL